MMGGGFNGYFAMYTTLKFPGIFGNVAIQSIDMGDEDQKVLFKQMKTNQEQPLLLYLDWGLYDMRATREGWDLGKANQDRCVFTRKRISTWRWRIS